MSLESARLSVGDRIVGFRLSSQTGEPKETGDFVGKPLVLFFYPKDYMPDAIALACGFQKILPELQKLNVNIIGISTDSVESHRLFSSEYGLTFPLLSDMNAKVSTAYGICRTRDVDGELRPIAAYTTFIINTNFRIIKVYEDFEPHSHPDYLLADLKELLRTEAPRHISIQAPVLLIPNVFDREFCQHLIAIWHTQGNGDSGFMKQVNGQTVAMFDYNHKIRRDHFLQEGETKERIKFLLGRRVTPEIWKAFHFNATRLEDLRIACYDASRGGYFRPHRDNTTSGTAHRRFAMSLNLNVGEYEGGYLKFPEYGSHLYRPNTGDAVIFSCSLLHEATDITTGMRFVLLTFFYGDQEAQMRQEYERRVQSHQSS